MYTSQTTYMLYRCLVLLSLIVMLSGCYPQRSLLHELNVEKRATQLPALQPSIDHISLENAYVENIVEEVSDTDGIVDDDYYRVTYMQGDPRINDVTILFERMVKDRWTSPYGEKQGYIDCRLTYYDQMNVFSLYFRIMHN